MFTLTKSKSPGVWEDGSMAMKDSVEDAALKIKEESNALPQTHEPEEDHNGKITSPQSSDSSEAFKGFESPKSPKNSALTIDSALEESKVNGINGDSADGYSVIKAKIEKAWFKSDNCLGGEIERLLNESDEERREENSTEKSVCLPARPFSPQAGPSGLSVKKPGRKRKRVPESDNIEPLPPESLSGKPQNVIEELNKANEILHLLYGLKNVYFYFGEEPLPDRYGTFSYYSIVKEPMWLDKARHKLLTGCYTSLDDFVVDIRLIVENAYRFWGPPHRISKRALVVEEKLYKKLNALPESTKKKLKCMTDRDSPSGSGRGFSEGSSPIMARVQIELEEERLKREQEAEIQLANSDDCETKTLKTWESDVLLTDEVILCIRHCSELVEIGQFFKLTQEILNIDDYTQYEVERMLAMPKESVSLQTIMTSIFSADHRRTMLDQTPLMPYEVWNAKVCERLDRWFGRFYDKCNKIECQEELGIEPFFWDVMGLLNPLKDKPFHEIQFYQRIWILKSLLDNLMVSSKAVQDFFAVENRMEGTNILGKGANNSRYVAITSFFPEIRIYRELVPRKAYTKESEGIEDIFCTFGRCRMLFNFDEKSQTGNFKPNDASFVNVAETLEDVEKLKKLAKDIKQKELLENLEAYTTSFLNYIPCGNKGMIALNKQWTCYYSRPPEYFKNMMNLWLSTIKPVNHSNLGPEAEIVTGKRKTSSQFSLAVLAAANISDSDEAADAYSEYSAYSSSDVDGEYVPSGYKKNKRKKKSPKPRERSESQGHEVSPAPSQSTVSQASIQNKDASTPKLLDFWSVESKKSSNPKQTDRPLDSSVVISSSEDESDPPIKSTSEVSILRTGVTVVPSNLPSSVTCEKLKPKLPPDIVVPSLPSGITISSSVQITKTVSLAPTKFAEVDIHPVRTPPKTSFVSREVTLQKVVVPNDDDDVVIVSGDIVMPKPLPVSTTSAKPKPKTPLPIPLSPQEWKAKFSKPRSSPRSPNSPIAARGASPRQSNISPLTKSGFSPRNPGVANRLPQPMSVKNGGWAGGQQRLGQSQPLPRRNLFNSGPVAELPTLTGPLVYNSNGGWRVNLPDGGYIPLTAQEIHTLKQNNNGRLPSRVTVPPR